MANYPVEIKVEIKSMDEISDIVDEIERIKRNNPNVPIKAHIEVVTNG